MEDRGEVVAFDVLHDDEGTAIVFEESMNRRDVGVIRLSSGRRLTQHTRPLFNVVLPRRQHALDRDFAVKRQVLGEIDTPHAAAAKRVDNQVGAEFGAGWQLVFLQRDWRRPGRRSRRVAHQRHDGLADVGIRAVLCEERRTFAFGHGHDVGQNFLHDRPGRSEREGSGRHPRPLDLRLFRLWPRAWATHR
jgi:hypothetical protein